MGWNLSEEGWDGTQVRKDWMEPRSGRWDGTKVGKGEMEPK